MARVTGHMRLGTLGKELLEEIQIPPSQRVKLLADLRCEDAEEHREAVRQ